MQRPPIQAVIFDMDGVLTDSEPLINAAAVAMFKEKGLVVQPDDFLPFVGTGENRYLGGVAGKYGFPIDIAVFKKRTYELYLELVPTRLEAFPRAQDLVLECRKAGLKIAVASSADRIKIDANLKKIGLPPELWDAILTGEDVVHKKPAPDIFLAAAARLGNSPGQCVVVEDAVSGIEAAKSAGMRCVAVAQSFTPDKLHAADLIRSKIADLTLDDLTGQPVTRANDSTGLGETVHPERSHDEPLGRSAHILSALDGGGPTTLQHRPEPVSGSIAQSGPEARAPASGCVAGAPVRKEEGASHEPAGRPWGLFATLGFSLVIALAFIAVQSVVLVSFVNQALMSNRRGLDGLESNGLYWAAATFASAPVVVGLTWLFVRLRKGIGTAEYLALRPVPWRQLFRWSVALLGLVVFSDLVTSLMDRSIVPDIMVQVHRTSHYLPLLWLALIVVAPLAEEVLFRGFMFAGMANSGLGVAGAVGVSSLAWAAIHLQYDVYGIGTVFVIGLFLGCVRHQTRSLYPCLVLHALMNLIAAVQTLVLVKFIGPGA